MSFMKKTKYEIEKICAFCEKSEKIFDDDNMLCEKYGVVPCTYKCRSFSYDPLKRVPPRTPKIRPLEYVDIDGDSDGDKSEKAASDTRNSDISDIKDKENIENKEENKENTDAENG